MNSPDMLDYVLGQLDGQSTEVAEREIAEDPALAGRVNRLRVAVDRLLDDGLDALEPPSGLARRTASLVAESRRRRRRLADYLPVIVPFRPADVAVAASIFLAGLLTLFPAVYRGKLQRSQLGCVFNLQQLGLALGQYANIHKTFPYAPPECPAATAGSFAFMLNDSHLLPDCAALDCPCDGPSATPPPKDDFPAVCEIQKSQPQRYKRMVGWDYAYHLGYRRGADRPVPTIAESSEHLPILADRPGYDGRRILAGNSPNHGGWGQNVLFTDGHVRWHHTRQIGPHDSDMYLNANQLPAPGIHERDATLAPGTFRFDGRP
jgi:prepilin-type processing-associated H-X9-DG protein